MDQSFDPRIALEAPVEPPKEEDFMSRLRSGMRRIGGPAVLQLLQLWVAARANGTPLTMKAALWGALGYFVMPMDAVPDAIPLAGFGDDVAVIAAALALAHRAISPEVQARAAELFSRLFSRA
ncbi:DUF1232 domain-containing protein [Rhodovarius crocodyli]|uniref:DUF1232 domain-containing protein n=2 Tax=Rhodovarius crocodyli TaxID=1979269 RepID=A0A437M402_9PROT|nr:DUF1232 domain-containing protein [Rhodovarius crocodyli]